MWELFSTTLLVEVKVVILKYGNHLHFLKSSVRRSKRSTHALARLAGRGAGVNGPPKSGSSPCGERDLFLLFSFLVSWSSSCMSPNRLQIKSPKSI
jgi:hypothetical protein